MSDARKIICNQVMRFADPTDLYVGNWEICTDNILAALAEAGLEIRTRSSIEALEAEVERLCSLLEGADQDVLARLLKAEAEVKTLKGDLSVERLISAAAEKEIARLKKALESEPPRPLCSCVIEMATFRHKGGTCPHCGGIIG